MKLLYLHGFLSSPQSAKATLMQRWLREQAPAVEWICPQLPVVPHEAIELARTLAVNMVIVLEIFHLFFIRNFHATSLTWEAVRGTPAVWITVAVVVVGQVLFTYAPFMHRLFSTRPVTLLDGAIVIGTGIAFFAMVEMEKQIRLRLTVSSPA